MILFIPQLEQRDKGKHGNSDQLQAFSADLDSIWMLVFFTQLEHGDEGKHGVDQGAGVCHQGLLVMHGERGDEELGGRPRAPQDGEQG